MNTLTSINRESHVDANKPLCRSIQNNSGNIRIDPKIEKIANELFQKINGKRNPNRSRLTIHSCKRNMPTQYKMDRIIGT